ncbi:hypothetical protein G9A89_020431 [Geosiphon pyriformis]|nr:hypothetical protein G9A89_020431 [Geosiphon pyriformis]
MELPTEIDLVDIFDLLLKAQRDQFKLKRNIDEKYKAVEQASLPDALSTTKIDPRPLHVLEDDYIKLDVNIRHLSERHALASSLYHISHPFENGLIMSLEPSKLTAEAAISESKKPKQLRYLWPSLDRKIISEGEGARRESHHSLGRNIKKLNESLLNMPVLINTRYQSLIRENSKDLDYFQFGYLGRWYWELKHYESMEMKKSITPIVFNDHQTNLKSTFLKDRLMTDLIAFDTTYRHSVKSEISSFKNYIVDEKDKLMDNSGPVKELRFITRRFSHVIIVRIISYVKKCLIPDISRSIQTSSENLTSNTLSHTEIGQHSYIVIFDYDFPKSRQAFHNMLQEYQLIFSDSSRTHRNLQKISLINFITTILWPEIDDEFRIPMMSEN